MLSNCPRCEVDLPKGNHKFCPECGYQLPLDDAPSPIAVAPIRELKAATISKTVAPPPVPPVLHSATTATQARPLSTMQLRDMMPCPACGQMISRKATACPSCAHPIAYNPAPGSPNRPIVIEKTAKRWKGLQLIGALTMILGVMTCAGSASQPQSNENTVAVATLAAVAGLFIFIIGRFLAWWNHG
jgi:hypothetical protein